MKRILLAAALAVIVLVGCERDAEPPEKSTQIGDETVGLLAKAEAGDVTAMLSLANAASNALPPDQSKAFHWLLRAAEAGSPEASYEVATRYKEGNGVRTDYEVQHSWMDKSAKAGYAPARLEAVRNNYWLVGGVYLFESSSKTEAEVVREIVEELTKLKELGITEAIVDLAAFLHSGVKEWKDGKVSGMLLVPDKPKARELLLPLANNGVASAQRYLAIWAEEQDAQGTVATAGEDWWSKLSDQKDARELYLAGAYFDVGSTEENYKKLRKKPSFQGRALTFYESSQKALEWFEKSAMLGNVNAMLKSAEIHKAGLGTMMDDRAAFKWHQKAADAGSPEGQVAVAKAYYWGTGVVKDWNQAFEWAMKAATHPTASALEMSEGQRHIAWHYVTGNVVEKDLPTGYAWLNIAAAAGDEDAKKQRENLEKKMKPAELLEGQRLSSKWKPGEKVVRTDAKPADASGKDISRDDLSPKVRVQGTGFFVNKKGDILTNYHIVDGCSEIRLPALSATATMVIADKANDLAVVHTAFKPDDVPALMDSTKVKQGQDIIVFGYPLDGYLPTAGNITTGLVSALAGPSNNSSLIQISAPVQQGNSGGPVLDRKGNIVGVVVGKADAIRVAKLTGDIPQNINFAISVGTVRSFLETNQITFDTPSWWAMSKDAADLADAARRFTVKVECVR